jgi:hypothetical protein
MTNPKRLVTKAASINVRWAATEQGPVTFDVRYRSASPRSGFGDYVDLAGPTEETSTRLEADDGMTYCFSARASDQAGNASPWSGELCSVAPLDDRDLAGAAQWTRRSGSKFYRETLKLTRGADSSLIARDVRVRAIRVVVQRCPGCGRVAVFFNGNRVDTIDLHAGRTRNQRVVRSASFGRVRRGDISLVVISRDRPVKIDGLVLLRKT